MLWKVYKYKEKVSSTNKWYLRVRWTWNESVPFQSHILQPSTPFWKEKTKVLIFKNPSPIDKHTPSAGLASMMRLPHHARWFQLAADWESPPPMEEQWSCATWWASDPHQLRPGEKRRETELLMDQSWHELRANANCTHQALLLTGDGRMVGMNSTWLP